MGRKKEILQITLPILCMLGLLLAIISGVYFFRKNESQKQVEIHNKGDALGVYLEFIDKKNFFIDMDSSQYYYYINSSGVIFDKCVIDVFEPEVQVVDGEVNITVENFERDRNKRRVRIDDSRKIIDKEGKEKRHFMHSFYICGKDFSRDSIVAGEELDAKHKADKAYNAVNKYLSSEDLKSYYDQAISLENQFNDR